MELVPYRDLENQVLERLGGNPADNQEPDIQPEDLKANQRVLSLTLGELWRHFWWAPLMRTEKRAFRDAYATGTTYTAGNQVFFTATQKYYAALRTTTGNDPADSAGNTNLDYWAELAVTYSPENFDATKAYAKGDAVYYPTNDKYYQAYAATVAGTLPTDASKWGELPLFERYVHKLQAGKTKIGQVRRVWDKNPQAYRNAKELPWRDRLDKVEVFAAVAVVWVEFKLRCPRLTGDTWDATLIYTPVDAEEGSGTVPVTPPLVRTGLAGVAALRALTSHADQQIEFLLYHTVEGDGGQGNVYFDLGSTLADDNGSVFKPNDIGAGSPGRWVRV